MKVIAILTMLVFLVASAAAFPPVSVPFNAHDSEHVYVQTDGANTTNYNVTNLQYAIDNNYLSPWNRTSSSIYTLITPVGINTQTPSASYALDVNGNANFSDISFRTIISGDVPFSRLSNVPTFANSSSILVNGQLTNGGVISFTINTSAGNPVGTFGNSTQIPVISVDSSGRITSASNTDIQNATTTQVGVTQLTDSVVSTSIVTAATPNAVKTAYDLADQANTTATNRMNGSGSIGTIPIFSGTRILGNSIITQPTSNNISVAGTVDATDLCISGGQCLSNVSAGGIIGTPNYFAIFTSANAVGNSIVSQSGTQVSIAGSLVVSSNLTVDANLSVRGNLSISQDATIAGYLFSQAYFHQSDARLKENIVTITNATQIVQDLHGVYFNWNSTLGRTTQQQVGLIAQEVEQVVPQVIGTDANGYKAVQYENLVAVLIQAVKEQQAQINTLQTRVNELENKTQ